MKTNKYLYGEYIPKDIPIDVIVDRMGILTVQLTEELFIDKSKRDSKRVKDLSDAIEFWSSINEK